MQPTPFSDFRSDWFDYTTVIGVIDTLFFLLPALVVLLLFTLVGREFSKFIPRLGRLSAMLVILLPVGGIFYALWNDFIFGNFYVTASADSPDEDFSPFSPVGSTWLTMQHGHALVPLWQLYLIWLGFAAAAWAITYLIYRVIGILARFRPSQMRAPYVHA